MGAWKWLFIASLLSVSGACIAVFVVRQLALQTQYTPIAFGIIDPGPADHPGPILVAQAGGALEVPSNTQEAFDRVRKINRDIVLEMDVQQSKDQQLVVCPEGPLDKYTNGKGLVGKTTWGELKNLDAGYEFQSLDGSYPFRGKGFKISLLSDLLSRYKGARIILDIHSNTVDIHKTVVEIVRSQHSEKNVIIQSPYDVVIASIRKLEPHWLFGTGAGELTRAVMMDSLFLAPSAIISGNVFIAPALRKGQPLVSQSLVDEIHRRRRRIFFSSVETKEQLQHALKMGIDGIMTNRPAYMHELLSKELIPKMDRSK